MIVVYVFSSGPASWISARAGNEAISAFFVQIYAPLIWLAAHGPEPIRAILETWTSLWALPIGVFY